MAKASKMLFAAAAVAAAMDSSFAFVAPSNLNRFSGNAVNWRRSHTRVMRAASDDAQEVGYGAVALAATITFILYTFFSRGLVDCFEEKQKYWDQQPGQYIPGCVQLVGSGIITDNIQLAAPKLCKLNVEACKDFAQKDQGARFLVGGALNDA
eukprot:CAMPEP_0197643184 /NCGR_PEP_ID=MMETSP1338-20131121/16598_1 /TAXON_ID=43686 ORGANISM="Pelagodinium beii, Strain RCC1491" /NCGR_SAMPLE_ID=MMETSP1338 /ASSEMBLY_ACC=CAM_ASM_000754 /LENGTH=152 /DNA_ID=CAMNT_0043216411 /DNA_START=105 /DNA_END=563 /DNA_ORIENTATION=+